MITKLIPHSSFLIAFPDALRQKDCLVGGEAGCFGEFNAIDRAANAVAEPFGLRGECDALNHCADGNVCA